MQTPNQAILWELWRISRTEFLVRVGFLCAAVLLISFLPAEMSEPELKVLNGVLILVMLATSVASSPVCFQFDHLSQGFSFRLGFTRPVTAYQLVGLPMLFTAVLATSCFLLPAFILRFVLDSAIPILGPAIVIPSAVLCFMSALWVPTSIPGKVTSLALLATCGIAAVFALHYHRGFVEPILMAAGKPEYYDFNWLGYLTILTISAIALIATVCSINRQRHGESLPSFGLPRPAKTLTAKPITQIAAFRNRFTAQCWFEFRRFGSTVLLFALLISIGAFVFVTVGVIAFPGWHKAPLVWLSVLVLSPPAFQFVGIDGALGIRCKQGAILYPSFDATRTLTNDQLTTIKLLMVAVCSFTGWTMIAATAGIQTWATGDFANWSRIAESILQHTGDVSMLWCIAGGLCAILTYISSCSVLMAFGLWLPLNGPRLMGLVILAYASLVLAIIDIQNAWSLTFLWTAYGYLISAAVLVICGLTLRRAYLAGSLGSPFFVGTFFLWLVYVPTVIVFCIRLLPENTPAAAIVLGCATLFVPLAATASVPLALASHRHA